MSAEKPKHDYHLVDPSPWPIYVSFATLVLAFGAYFNKIGCFCFEKQTLNPGEKASYDLVFYLDPELVKDPKTARVEDVTMSYTFFSSDYYKQSKKVN